MIKIIIKTHRGMIIYSQILNIAFVFMSPSGFNHQRLHLTIKKKNKQMKTTKIIYWILTGITALVMSFSSYAYLTAPHMAETFQHLGFPSYFRIELAFAKCIGVIVLLTPLTGRLIRLKEWAYAGFTFVYVSAVIAHASSGDPFAMFVSTIILLAILAGSYITYHKIQNKRV